MDEKNRNNYLKKFKLNEICNRDDFFSLLFLFGLINTKICNQIVRV